MVPMQQTLDLNQQDMMMGSTNTPESFLGANAGLVNLDNLVTKPVAPAAGPFTGESRCFILEFIDEYEQITV